MLQRELKINFKNFVIWLSILIGIFLIVYCIYPMIIQGDNIKEIDNLMKLFPQEVLMAFNMDITSLNSVFGWMKSEGFIFALLIIASYAGIMGSNILLKEENDKTIEYLISLPVTRRKIVISKIVCGWLYLIFMVLVFATFNYIGLSLSGTFDIKEFILLSITPFFSSLVIFSFCMFLSTFTNKTKKMIGISLGVVFVSYMLQVLSTLSNQVEFLKYISVFTLSDIRNVILNIEINPSLVILSFLLTFLFSIMTIVRYDSKELV